MNKLLWLLPSCLRSFILKTKLISPLSLPLLLCQVNHSPVSSASCSAELCCYSVCQESVSLLSDQTCDTTESSGSDVQPGRKLSHVSINPNMAVLQDLFKEVFPQVSLKYVSLKGYILILYDQIYFHWNVFSVHLAGTD